jgi:transcriptional regulator with XRE-family HTH domain
LLATAAEIQLRESLRGFRERAGLRQSDLSSRLGRPQSFVSKYESGERRLTFIEVREICIALGVRFSTLARTFEHR